MRYSSAMHVEHLSAVMLRPSRRRLAVQRQSLARRIYRELRALNLDVASPYWTEHVGGTVIFNVSDYWPDKSAPGIH
jgi:hypothetical protein